MLAVGVPRSGPALGSIPRGFPTFGTVLIAALLLCQARGSAQQTTTAVGVGVQADTTTAPTPLVTTSEPVVALPVTDSKPEIAWDLLHRRFSTWSGPTGGIGIVDASTGAPGAVRIQLGLDAFYGSDYLRRGDEINVRTQTLALSVTVATPLELFATLSNRGVTQTDPVNRELDTLGDFMIGAKIGAHLAPTLWLGADVRAQLGGQIGDAGLAWDSTSIGLRGAFTVDLRELEKPAPFVARVNVGYLFDSSANLVEDEEDRRYELDDSRPKADDTQHLVTRFERLAFGINRIDRFSIGVGLEAPLQLAEGFFLHPLVEWKIDVPVNRQDYDCAFVRGVQNAGTRSSDEDSCFERDSGVVPMNLVFGVRVVPPVRGVSVLLGADIGLTGTDVFVRELAPNLPYRLFIALGYDFDARPAPVQEVPVVQQVVAPLPVPVVPPAPPSGRLKGVVVTAEGVAISGAVVTFVGKPVTALSTGADGGFASEPFEAGEIQITVSHPSYDPGTCAATVPPTGGDVAVRCVLTVPPPKLGKISGRIVDTFGNPITNARIALSSAPVGPGAAASVSITAEPPAPIGASAAPSGTTGAQLASDGTGRFESPDLKPGDYALRVEAIGFFTRLGRTKVGTSGSTSFELALSRKPAIPSIMLRADNIVEARAITFSEGSAELNPAADQAVNEIAEVLLNRPTYRVRVQGYGSEAVAMPRALAIKRRMVDAGVEESRIEAASGGKRARITLLP